MPKIKTNNDLIKALVKDLDKNQHPILMAIFRERLMKMVEFTEKSIKENPEAWNNQMIHHSLYTELCTLIRKHIDF